MALFDLFIGVPQSKYAAIAILVALSVVALAMLVGKDEVPVGQKFLLVVLMLVIALPSVLLSLFQLTCLVTGTGMKNQRWWCGAYAWIGTIFIMLYSAIIVVIGIIAMTQNKNITKELQNSGLFEAMQVEANEQAREYFQDMNVEHMQDMNMEKMQDMNMEHMQDMKIETMEPGKEMEPPGASPSFSTAPVAMPTPAAESFADYASF